MTYIEEYYNQIKTGKVIVSHKVEVVYKKLLHDLKKPQVIKTYNETTEKIEKHTYIFDEKKAHKPIEFIEKFCRHSKGKWANKPIVLELWQKALVEAMYGFIDKETKLRKYRKVVLFVGRKNGKSTLASALALYHLTADGEGGAECYSVAVKKDQAKIVWEESKKMIKKSPLLKKRVKTLVNGLFYDSKDASYKALASSSDSLDGLNASFVSADETHAWKDKNLMDVMYDSMSAREQPMLFETSTMGNIRESVFDNEYEYIENVIAGYEGIEGGIEDNTLLPIIYELDKKEYWTDEKKWYQANPSLGNIKKLDEIRNKVKRARNNPTEVSNLLCKDFNIRVTSEEKWLTFETANNEDTYNIDDLQDTYAIGGADLSSTTDLTCATLIVIKHGTTFVLQQYFIANAKLEEKIKEDKIPYDVWNKRGLVTLCDGAKVNYSDVTAWFVKMHNEYQINALWVGYDPWNAQYWVEEMQDTGFTMIEVRQGFKTLSNPMKQLEADLIEKKVNYNNNPVLKWCLTNTAVKRDENDNIRPVKGKQQRARIDGSVSLLIAYCILAEKYTDYMNLMGE
ncbi:MAG: terminase large subunit [Clostridia bacterium]|nr:terminase large subunit [Clostridia bacterium]